MFLPVLITRFASIQPREDWSVWWMPALQAKRVPLPRGPHSRPSCARLARERWARHPSGARPPVPAYIASPLPSHTGRHRHRAPHPPGLTAGPARTRSALSSSRKLDKGMQRGWRSSGVASGPWGSGPGFSGASMCLAPAARERRNCRREGSGQTPRPSPRPGPPSLRPQPARSPGPEELAASRLRSQGSPPRLGAAVSARGSCKGSRTPGLGRQSLEQPWKQTQRGLSSPRAPRLPRCGWGWGGSRGRNRVVWKDLTTRLAPARPVRWPRARISGLWWYRSERRLLSTCFPRVL